MKYFVYQTTNLVNGKIYVGVHADDGRDYLGSGIRLKQSIAKHGRAAFKREVLFRYETAEEAFAKEAEIVTAEFIARKDTYNFKLGGLGGWDHVHATGKFNVQNLRRDPEVWNKSHETLRRRLIEDEEFARRFKLQSSLRAMGNTNRLGKKRSPEELAKASANRKGKNVGSDNPGTGTKWMHHPDEPKNKRVGPTDIDQHLASGWVIGRMKYAYKPNRKKRIEKCRPRRTAPASLRAPRDSLTSAPCGPLSSAGSPPKPPVGASS
ncbi:hypothetical protein PUR29_34825 [Methylobacterium ajmalii]|uniref:GIY-YIG domain-containing protein n=1 Tax=Methylobacterium ajmalii TaxID=2738439 RepID=A0ABV0A5U3_9HYPH